MRIRIRAVSRVVLEIVQRAAEAFAAPIDKTNSFSQTPSPSALDQHRILAAYALSPKLVIKVDSLREVYAQEFMFSRENARWIQDFGGGGGAQTAKLITPH